MTSWLSQLAPPPLPSWTATAIVLAVALAVFVPTYALFGSGATIAASGGFALGAFTVASVGLRGGWQVLAFGSVAALLPLAFPAPLFSTIVAVTLALLAGVELVRTGTRCMVMAIFAALAVQVGAAMSGGPWMGATFLAGVAAGAVALRLAGLSAIVPAMREPPVVGAAMAVFLIVGLTISIALVLTLQGPRSYWIALLFVTRALLPLQAQRGAAIRFGKGAGLGVLLAVALELMALPTWVRLSVALFAGAIGMRYTIHPLPISSAAFSAAILLGAAATLREAIYRAEAIAIVVGLVLFLVFAMDRIWTRLATLFPDQRMG